MWQRRHKSAENRASVPGIVAAEPFALAAPAAFQNPPQDGPPQSGDIATTLAWYQRQTKSSRWSPNPTPTGETQGRHPVLMNMIPRSPPVQTMDGSDKARGAPAPVPDAYRCKLSATRRRTAKPRRPGARRGLVYGTHRVVFSSVGGPAAGERR